MTVAPPVGEQRITLRGVSWSTYERLVEELEDRAGVRLTYLRGDLELMAPSYAHDWLKRLIGRVIEVYTLERGIPIKSGGSTTFKKADLERGLEPDECYWIGNEPRVRLKSEIDLAIDPPPDLAVEVEISRSVVDKLDVYAGIGVPEVWRHDGEALHVLTWTPSGGYQPSTRSEAFPGLPLVEVERVLALRDRLDETSLIREFQQGLRADSSEGADSV